MQNKKPTKPKQGQHNLLSSVLVQFDIQTQVNKMVMRSFDSLMRSNKQAFDFIQQSEHKFIEFQQRLSKAETYYKNIELNINSKVELTENMNNRLEQFSTQFWSSIKQNNSEVTSMTKRFDQVLMQKRELQNRMSQCQKQILRVDNSLIQLNEKINRQILKLIETITQNEKKTDLRFTSQSRQIGEISQNIIQSRSLLQSKSGMLSQLLKDLQLYKNDRPQIKGQLQTVFGELQNRAMKSDVIQVRGYVDSKIVEERQSMNKLWMRIDTQVKVEERDRKRDVERLNKLVKQINVSMEQRNAQLEQLIRKQLDQLTSIINNNEQQTNKQIQQLIIMIQGLETTYTKQIPQVQHKLSQITKQVTQDKQRTIDLQNEIGQLFSNTQSINQMISMMVKQNQQRKQEMVSLTSKESSGNNEQRLLGVIEQVEWIKKQIDQIKSLSILKIIEEVSKIEGKLTDSQSHIENEIQSIHNHIIQNNQSCIKQLKQSSTHFNQLIATTTNNISQNISILKQSTQQLIEQKLTSIEHKLTSLDSIHQQIQQFKQVFKHQLKQNQTTNESIKEKMERVMALFTKLKSDTNVRFQSTNSQLTKRTTEIKSSLNQLTQIKSYLSLSNQTINLLLATNIFALLGSNNTNSNNNTKESSSVINSTITMNNNYNNYNNSAQNNNKDKQKDQLFQTNKPIKVTSMLQGWILQNDQSQDKLKYRGEKFTLSNTIKFLLAFLQFSIQKTQKIKGTILQNGRDVFMRVLESKQHVFTQRKRISSRRKPSELPKLHI